jgi:tripartite-type tricarboxylate transporter receptor subunit TctC
MIMKKKIIRFVCMTACAVLLTVSVFAGGAGESGRKTAVRPNDPLEFATGFGPGSGHDLMLRTMEKAIRNHNLIQNPIIYTYKPGANTSLGQQYTKSQSGRSDLIMATTSQIVIVPLQTDIGMTRKDLTNICLWGPHYQYLWVTKKKAEEEGWKTLNDMLTCGKPITFTNNGVGSSEELIVLALKGLIPGADFRPIAVNGGDGEAVTMLMGGHIDVFVNELSGGGLEGFRATGDVIPLAICGPKRSKYAPDVPTLMECGYDFAWDSFRGITAPPNISEDAINWWINLMSKIKDTPEFIAYMEANGVEPDFMVKDEMEQYIVEFEKRTIARFKNAGYKILPRWENY